MFDIDAYLIGEYLATFESQLLKQATTSNDQKPPKTSTNDYKPPANDHKPPVNDKKSPANDHKPPANDHKLPTNNDKRRNRPFPNFNYLIFLYIVNEAEFDRCK